MSSARAARAPSPPRRARARLRRRPPQQWLSQSDGAQIGVQLSSRRERPGDAGGPPNALGLDRAQ
eukprot:11796769-Alexandrium_andersonii.AAC.1